MARASYQAPGVYVEEVPSAQQPIAGVGTNTAGFIGAVPDTIKCPVPNPHYDPVLAELALKVTEIVAKGGQVSQDDMTNMDRQVKSLEDEIAALNTNISGWETTVGKDTAQLKDIETRIGELEGRESPPLSDEERGDLSKRKKDKTRLNKEIDEFNNKITIGKENRDDKKGKIDGLKAAMDGKAASDGGQNSALRPYKLKEVPVNVEAADTKLCTNFSEYTNRFGPFSAYQYVKDPDNPNKWKYKPLYPGHSALTHAVYGFFKNGGTRCFVARVSPDNPDTERVKTAFESIDEIAIIAAPGLDGAPVWDMLVTHCELCEDRFAILDCAADVEDEEGYLDIEKLSYTSQESELPSRNRNAAFYFPYIEVLDPAKQLQDLDPALHVEPQYRGRVYVPPSGHVAGIYARTDEERGVHKAPANTAVLGALDVKYYISKPKQELLNPQGVNCIRVLNGNVTVWGARTVGGDANGEWKYVSVRRFFLFLRESIDEGTQWCVFEPNDTQLWGKIRRNVSGFLTTVWRNGALFGLTPQEAFFVRCDAELNPPEVRDLGMVVTEIGVAIVRPAEFVIFRVTQSVGEKSG